MLVLVVLSYISMHTPNEIIFYSVHLFYIISMFIILFYPSISIMALLVASLYVIFIQMPYVFCNMSMFNSLLKYLTCYLGISILFPSIFMSDCSLHFLLRFLMLVSLFLRILQILTHALYILCQIEHQRCHSCILVQSK